MRKYLTVIIILSCLVGHSQTTQVRAGFFADGRPGKKFIDTVYLLSNLPNTYFNGFGNFVSLPDSVRAQFSGTANRITITSGVIDIGTDVVTLTGTQTLTNKTLSQPVINSTTSSDTGTYKPIGVSSGGVTRSMTYWPGSGGGGGSTGWALTGNSITAGGSFLGTTNNTSLLVSTNNQNVMRVDSFGNVRVITRDTTTLTKEKGMTLMAPGIIDDEWVNLRIMRDPAINTNQGFYWRYTHNAVEASRSLALQSTQYSPGSNSLTLLADGKVGIGTATPTDRLSIVGGIGITGGTMTTSGNIAITSAGTFSMTGGGALTNNGGNIVTNGGGFVSVTNSSTTGTSVVSVLNNSSVGGSLSAYGSSYVASEYRNNVVFTANNDFLLICNPSVTGPTTTKSIRLRPGGYASNGQILKALNNGIKIEQSTDNSPVASAILDIASTTQGVLLPRMTKTQRDAISSPATGLMIFQTDNTPGLRVYNGTNWMKYTEATD